MFKSDWKPAPREKKPRQWLKRTPLRKKFPKNTGQLKTFNEIWNERAHYCQVCRDELKVFNKDFFSHLLPKKNYTYYINNKENIWLMCCNRRNKCHDLWHNATKEMKKEEMWISVFREYDRLKTEYNIKYK
jgi:hypothetical protein